MKIAVMSDTHFKEFTHASIPVYCVSGNNDGDIYLLTKTASRTNGLITLYGLLSEMDVRGFFMPEQKQTGNTLLLNPGDVMGKEGDAGFCILDTENRSVSRLTIN